LLLHFRRQLGVNIVFNGLLTTSMRPNCLQIVKASVKKASAIKLFLCYIKVKKDIKRRWSKEYLLNLTNAQI
jgi:hypothetical protein